MRHHKAKSSSELQYVMQAKMLKLVDSCTTEGTVKYGATLLESNLVIPIKKGGKNYALYPRNLASGNST